MIFCPLSLREPCPLSAPPPAPSCPRSVGCVQVTSPGPQSWPGTAEGKPGGQVPRLSPRPPPCPRPLALEVVPFGTALSPSPGTLATLWLLPTLAGWWCRSQRGRGGRAVLPCSGPHPLPPARRPGSLGTPLLTSRSGAPETFVALALCAGPWGPAVSSPHSSSQGGGSCRTAPVPCSASENHGRVRPGGRHPAWQAAGGPAFSSCFGPEPCVVDSLAGCLWARAVPRAGSALANPFFPQGIGSSPVLFQRSRAELGHRWICLCDKSVG